MKLQDKLEELFSSYITLSQMDKESPDYLIVLRDCVKLEDKVLRHTDNLEQYYLQDNDEQDLIELKELNFGDD